MKTIVFALLMSLLSTAYAATSSFSFVGRNSVDSSICRIRYAVSNNHILSIRIDGTLWSNSIPLPMVKNSFEIGGGTTCLGNAWNIPIVTNGDKLQLLVPSVCHEFKSDADYLRYYNEDRQTDFNYAYTVQLVGSVTKPTEFSHSEEITGDAYKHLGSSINCRSLVAAP